MESRLGRCRTSHLSHPAQPAFGMKQRAHRRVGYRCWLGAASPRYGWYAERLSSGTPDTWLRTNRMAQTGVACTKLLSTLGPLDEDIICLVALLLLTPKYVAINSRAQRQLFAQILLHSIGILRNFWLLGFGVVAKPGFCRSLWVMRGERGTNIDLLEEQQSLERIQLPRLSIRRGKDRKPIPPTLNSQP